MSGSRIDDWCERRGMSRPFGYLQGTVQDVRKVVLTKEPHQLLPIMKFELVLMEAMNGRCMKKEYGVCER